MDYDTDVDVFIKKKNCKRILEILFFLVGQLMLTMMFTIIFKFSLTKEYPDLLIISYGILSVMFLSLLLNWLKVA